MGAISSSLAATGWRPDSGVICLLYAMQTMGGRDYKMLLGLILTYERRTILSTRPLHF